MKKKMTFGDVEYIANFTGTPDDFTDEAGRGWLRPATLAARFRELCAATGMTGKSLAAYAGITPATLCNYRNGFSPVPAAVWRLVESRKL